MAMQLSIPEDRFSVTHFGSGTADVFTMYRCPKCKEETAVVNSQVKDDSTNRKPIFSNSIISKMEKLRPVNKDGWEGCYDFTCCKCGSGVRAIYELNDFRMAAYNFILKAVIET